MTEEARKTTQKTILIYRDQDDWISKTGFTLSRFVRKSLDKIMKNTKCHKCESQENLSEMDDGKFICQECKFKSS